MSNVIDMPINICLLLEETWIVVEDVPKWLSTEKKSTDLLDVSDLLVTTTPCLMAI